MTTTPRFRIGRSITLVTVPGNSHTCLRCHHRNAILSRENIDLEAVWGPRSELLRCRDCGAEFICEINYCRDADAPIAAASVERVVECAGCGRDIPRDSYACPHCHSIQEQE